MKGLKSTPFVSCVKGFHFVQTSRRDPFDIALSGIVFRQTPMMFQDCNSLNISSCTMEDTSIALRVYMKHNTRALLNIHRSSHFRNNTSCLEIIYDNGASVNYHFLALNIEKTSFSENGFHKSQFAKGVITIKSNSTKPSNLRVQISCYDITAVKNYGHFIRIDLPTAVTDEVYKNVRLFNNSIFEFIKGSLGRRTRQTVDSLYDSTTKKTRVKFSNLRCSHNQLLRGIKMHSDEVQSEIYNSSFVGLGLPNKRGGAIFFNSRVRGSLVLHDCRFHRSTARAGGALFAHIENGTLTLNVTNVNFTECAASTYGCAILVEDLKSRKAENRKGTYQLISNFRNTRVRDCFAFQGKCTSAVSFVLVRGKVAIHDSSWVNNVVDNALMVAVTGSNNKVIISGCNFTRNIRGSLGVISVTAENPQAGTLSIIDSVVSGHSKACNVSLAILASSEFQISLINLMLNSHWFGILIGGSEPNSSTDAYPLQVSIYNCTFVNNIQDAVISSPDPTQVNLIIENTIFTRGKTSRTLLFGLLFDIFPLRVLNTSKAIVEFDNVTFDSKPCNSVGLLFSGNKTLNIKRSSFRNGLCSNTYDWEGILGAYGLYKISAGAISITTTADEKVDPGCVKEGTNEDVHVRYNYETSVLFEDTSFERNGGLIAGGVYICNGYTTFHRCTFRNNFGVEHSGHVYSAYGTGKVDFKDCFFSSSITNITTDNVTFHKSTILQSETGGPINLQNTTMMSFDAVRNSYPVVDISNGGYVHMDDNSSIQCSIGSKLLLDNSTHFVHTEQNNNFCPVNITVLRYSCQLCQSGFYSIQQGVSRGLTVNRTVVCQTCPFGANCMQKNIAAKPNFWGYSISTDPPSLIFIACPDHYCQQPTSESQGYNKCRGNRSGTLCGKCGPGYSESLFSAECRKNERCNNYWFWILTVLLTNGLVLYLLRKPPILSFLANHILWFKRRDNNLDSEQLDETNPHADSGYIKITFYFYQAAELLMVGSIESILKKIPFVYTVVAAFNFQVRTINRGIGCPFPGLTAVTKQLVLSGTVFLTMANIVVMYCVHCVINISRRKEKPSLFHYMAVVMEVLLLGYERLAETCLKLMNCVSIGSEKRLFIDANVQCMQWWQYFLLAYIAVFVVPFIIVLYIGSTKLHSASITAIEFLAACMFPLPFLIYWCCKKTEKRHGKTSINAPLVNKDVLEVLHAPFRAPNNEDKGTLYWESVLIGRRFILLTCHSFITSSMLRMISMAAACSLIALHHVVKNPFRDPMANRAETLSLAVLLMIAMINLTKATLISFGITIDGPYRSYLETLEWFEVGALAVVPALVTVLVIFAILSQLARFVFFLIEKAVHCCQRPGSAHWPWDEQRKPLLEIAA